MMKRRISNICLLAMMMVLGCQDAGFEDRPTKVPSTNPADYGVFVVPNQISLDETGAPAVFRVYLTTMPGADVVVDPVFSDTSEFTVNAANVVLNHQNYMQGIEFVVQPLDDGLRDGSQTVSVNLMLYSNDWMWSQVPVQSVAVTCHDTGVKPALDFVVTPSNLELHEGGEAGSMVVTLTEAPTSEVVVTPSFSDASEFTISPSYGTITQQNWMSGIEFKLFPKEDGQADGDQQVPVTLTLSSSDVAWQSLPPKTTHVVVKDSGQTGTKIRFMAANTTSGTGQDYDDGKGIRMFQAMKPDIILIQEFAYTNGLRQLVDTAFGPEFHYYPGSGGNIPNGIISRYPIISTGTWDSKASDRENEWAIIDIPGNRELLAVSVHLLRSSVNEEYKILRDRIGAKVKEGNYYVVLGGDFNAKNRTAPAQTLGSLLQFKKDSNNSKDRCIGSSTYPVDQNGNNCTSAERDDPYDWILFDPQLDKFEVPVVIGNRSYPNGHVLDSRVYDEHHELDTILPVKAEDSWKCSGSPNCEDDSKNNQFQHMPVIRDLLFYPTE